MLPPTTTYRQGDTHLFQRLKARQRNRERRTSSFQTMLANRRIPRMYCAASPEDTKIWAATAGLLTWVQNPFLTSPSWPTLANRRHSPSPSQNGTLVTPACVSMLPVSIPPRIRFWPGTLLSWRLSRASCTFSRFPRQKRLIQNT